MTTTIRVTVETRDLLRALARQTGLSLQELVRQALEGFRRQQLLAQTNAAYAALEQNPHAWRDLEREREEWDGTLGDGLPEER